VKLAAIRRVKFFSAAHWHLGDVMLGNIIFYHFRPRNVVNHDIWTSLFIGLLVFLSHWWLLGHP